MNEQLVIKDQSSFYTTLLGCRTAISYLSLQHRNTLQQLLTRIRKANMKDSWSKDIGVPVKVTNHALERWNTRVGPYMQTKKELANYLTIILAAKVKRYEMLQEPNKKFENYLIEIENEIVGAFIIDKGEIAFTTFFGRLSKVPALANWYFLQHFNLKKGRLNNRIHDHVKLEFPIEQLMNENLPAAPVAEWFINGNRTNYIVEKYFVAEQQEPIYLVLQCHNKHKEWIVINTATTCDKKISNRLLQLLKLDGQVEFVTKYLSQKLIKSKKVLKVG